MYAKSKQHSNKAFVRRPEFNVIGNLYDELSALTDRYGFEQVLLHLGEVARTNTTRDLSSKIWSILNMEKRVETKALQESE